MKTKELDDGLEVFGGPMEDLKEGVSVHCYDDHRVAMAFSVLGTVIKNTVIEEKRCVEKTWPNWWDDLENKVGLVVFILMAMATKLISRWVSVWKALNCQVIKFLGPPANSNQPN